MAKTAAKGHQKAKPRKRVVYHEGKAYEVGKDVELRLCYNEKGKKIGMRWCGKNDPNVQFQKHRNDEVLVTQ